MPGVVANVSPASTTRPSVAGGGGSGAAGGIGGPAGGGDTALPGAAAADGEGLLSATSAAVEGDEGAGDVAPAPGGVATTIPPGGGPAEPVEAAPPALAPSGTLACDSFSSAASVADGLTTWHCRHDVGPFFASWWQVTHRECASLGASLPSFAGVPGP